MKPQRLNNPDCGVFFVVVVPARVKIDIDLNSSIKLSSCPPAQPENIRS